MHSVTEWLRLNFRICLSATLMIEAAIGLLPALKNCGVPSIVGGMGQGLQMHSTALSALYFVLSIWLVFGIRTSLVAAMAAVLLVLPAIVTTPTGDPALAVKITLVTVFSVPLIFYGGGRYAVYETEEPWQLSEDPEEDPAQA